MPLFSDEDRRRYFGSRLQGKRTTFLSKSKPKTRENLLKSKPKAKIQSKNKEKSAKIQTKKAATYLQATALIHYSILCSNTLLPFNKYFILIFILRQDPKRRSHGFRAPLKGRH